MATQWTANVTAGQVLTAAKLQEIGAAWETYTPALTASTTNPNLGSTGSASGKWARLQKIIIGHGQFIFGGVGVTAGSGFYYYSLPTAAIAAGMPAGSVIAIDVSSFASVQNTSQVDTTTRLVGYGTGGAGLAGTIQATTFPWASGDIIRFSFIYEAA